MYRNIMNDLATWYEEKRRRILYLKGALGVGKTWTIKDFSTAFFSTQIYIDVKEETFIKELIEGFSITDNASSEKILLLEKYILNNYPDFNSHNTIIIFDNIQNIIGIDEFFHEFSRTHRDYVICLVASSMEISEYQYHHPDVFKILRMRPMTFEEYIIATKSTHLLAAVESSKNKPINEIEAALLTKLLQEYLITGGLPEIVHHFIKHKDYNMVKELQQSYLDKIRNSIKVSSSYAVSERMRRIFNSIGSQLTHDNKKFMYKYVDENARAREYSDAVQRLCDLGFVRKVPRMLEASFPIEEHIDDKSFELFLYDHGLLRRLFNSEVSENLTCLDILTENNGAIAEQYIFQELFSKMGNVYYWVSGATARVPFIYESDIAPVPVDIRFTENKKAQNIKTFRSKNPNTEISIKVSLSQVFLDDKVLNIPAYGLWNM